MSWIRNRSVVEKAFWVMLVFGLLGRLLVVPYGIYVNDMKYWVGWGQTLVNQSWSEYFTVDWTDRMPGGILYLLWALAGLQKLFAGLSNEFIYKLPANIADTVLAYMVFRWVGKRWGEEKGLLAALLYFFNPFVWHVSALWGQMDSVQALLMLLVVLALFRNWYGVATSLLVYAVQFKPHSVIVAPLVLIYLWQTREGWKDFGKKVGAVVLIVLGVWWVLSIPFLPHTMEYSTDVDKIVGPFKLGWEQWQVAKDAYPYASVNAFNFWGAMRLSWETDTGQWLGVSHNTWGVVMFGGVSLAVLSRLLMRRGKPEVEDYLYVTALLSLVAFTFLTRVHERHIFPFFLFYLLVMWSRSYRLAVFVLLTLIMVGNSLFAYGWSVGDPWLVPNGSGMVLFSLLFVVMSLGCALRASFNSK